jgi:ureidoacrylate peracid hydrolase
MDSEHFRKSIGTLDKVRKGQVDFRNAQEEAIKAFLEEFNLLDPRTFALEVNTYL